MTRRRSISDIFDSSIFSEWEEIDREINKTLAAKATLERIDNIEYNIKVLTKRIDQTQIMASLFAGFLLQDPERRNEWEKYRDEHKQKMKSGHKLD